MIISPGRKYIFVHAPKTGGTSLALALEGRAMKDDLLIGDTPKAKRRAHRLKGLDARGRLWKHARLDDIEGIVDADAMTDFFVLMMVRNPWDRMVSYYHWLRAQKFRNPAVLAAKSLDFSRFLMDEQIQASFRSHPFGRYVSLPSGQERCDLFVRLEHLETDMAPFIAHLGFDPGPIPHINASDRSADYRSYYTDQTAELVADICAKDVARFRYSF